MTSTSMYINPHAGLLDEMTACKVTCPPNQSAENKPSVVAMKSIIVTESNRWYGRVGGGRRHGKGGNVEVRTSSCSPQVRPSGIDVQHQVIFLHWRFQRASQ